MSRTDRLQWREIVFPRPLTAEAAADRLRAVATDPRSPVVVLEARGQAGRVRFLLGCLPTAQSRVAAELGVVVVALSSSRRPVTTARRVRFGNRHQQLAVDRPEQTAAQLLGALSHPCDGEELVLQVVLGARLRPTRPSASLAAPTPLVRALWGASPSRPDAAQRSALATKTSEPGFEAVVRLGVAADRPERRSDLALGLLGALRQLATPGVDVRLSGEKPSNLDRAALPWTWPLRLNVREVAAVAALPVGEEDLPGLSPLHPRLLPPVPAVTKGGGLVIGEATAQETSGGKEPTLLHLSPEALLRHVAVTGPTGTGKSVLLEHLVLDHVRGGHGAVVIEPKSDLVRALLAKIPESRRDDVVLLDPSGEHVVGLNPLAGSGRPELRADAILHVFTDLFRADIGPRSTDILHSALLTLARSPGTSLVQIPRLLSDVTFRSRLVGKVADDPLLAGFWAGWESLAPTQQNTIAAPLMNKLRYVLLRPSIRAVLGQTQPKFDVAEVFTGNKILLVPLPVATLGAEGSALLGSLVVSALWNAAQARTLLPADQRPPVMVCLDEFQNYCRLPDIEDALATSRSLGVGWVLAHQFLDQLPTSTKAAVSANVRSRIVFQLAHDDAAATAKTTTGRTGYELSPADFMALRPFHIYASLLAGGQVQPFASGRTLPPEPDSCDPDELAQASARRYGRSLNEIAGDASDGAAVAVGLVGETIGTTEALQPSAPAEPVGSRRRRQRQNRQNEPQPEVSARPSDRSTDRVELESSVPAGEAAGAAESSHASSSDDDVPSHGCEPVGDEAGCSEPRTVTEAEPAAETESVGASDNPDRGQS